MAWIKLDHDTLDKPEVIRLADLLGMDQDAVVGKLVKFWIWCDKQTVDGDAPGVTPGFIDRHTNCPGLASGLLEVGWLRERNGLLSIPNFDRHNGQSAKKRALAYDRKKRSRHAASVTKTGQQRDKSVTRIEKEENRREDLNTEEGVPSSCSEAHVVRSEPDVISYPTNGKVHSWGIKQREIDDFQKCYPGVKVHAELLKALAWCNSNAAKRKTAGGMLKFLNSWLARVQDNGARNGPSQVNRAQQREASNASVVNNFLEKLGVENECGDD